MQFFHLRRPLHPKQTERVSPRPPPTPKNQKIHFGSKLPYFVQQQPRGHQNLPNQHNPKSNHRHQELPQQKKFFLKFSKFKKFQKFWFKSIKRCLGRRLQRNARLPNLPLHFQRRLLALLQIQKIRMERPKPNDKIMEKTSNAFRKKIKHNENKIFEQK